MKGADRAALLAVTWGRASPLGQGRGRGTHVFGGLAQDVPHAAAVAQPVVHDGDDAHEQGVTGPLRAVWLLVLYKWGTCSDPGQARCFHPHCTQLLRHTALTCQDLRHGDS